MRMDFKSVEKIHSSSHRHLLLHSWVLWSTAPASKWHRHTQQTFLWQILLLSCREVCKISLTSKLLHPWSHNPSNLHCPRNYNCYFRFWLQINLLPDTYFPPPWGEGGVVYFIILSSHHLLHGHHLFPCQVLHFLCTSSERFAQNCLIFPVSFLGDLCLPAQSPCFWLDCPPLGSDHLLSLKVFRPLCLLCLYTLALPGLTHNPVWEKHKGLHCYLRGLIRMIPGNSGYGAEPWWKSFLGQSHSWFTKLILDYSCYGQSWQVTWWGLESSWM